MRRPAVGDVATLRAWTPRPDLWPDDRSARRAVLLLALEHAIFGAMDCRPRRAAWYRSARWTAPRLRSAMLPGHSGAGGNKALVVSGATCSSPTAGWAWTIRPGTWTRRTRWSTTRRHSCAALYGDTGARAALEANARLRRRAVRPRDGRRGLHAQIETTRLRLSTAGVIILCSTGCRLVVHAGHHQPSVSTLVSARFTPTIRPRNRRPGRPGPESHEVFRDQQGSRALGALFEQTPVNVFRRADVHAARAAPRSHGRLMASRASTSF